MDRIIDSHCHLNEEIYEDLSSVINNYKKNGIKYVVVPGWDFESSVKAIELTKEKSIYAAIGIHPENIESLDINEIDRIETLLWNNKIAAIGEIGLDYHYTKENKDIQKEFFIKQIDLAIKYNLPFIVHMRDSDQDTLDLLKDYKKRNNIDKYKGIMHSYSGSSEMMKEFIKLGFYISFSGPITYKNAINNVKCAKECPLDKLLIETDSPYLTPVPYRGKRNEPANVRYVLSKIAEIKEVNETELENIIYNNFVNVFNISEEQI